MRTAGHEKIKPWRGRRAKVKKMQIRRKDGPEMREKEETTNKPSAAEAQPKSRRPPSLLFAGLQDLQSLDFARAADWKSAIQQVGNLRYPSEIRGHCEKRLCSRGVIFRR
jgi:hypothetical protein